MQPTFQTSFIPKKTIINEPGHSSNVVRDINVISIVSSIIFVLSLATYGGLFLYKNILIKQIKNADEEIKRTKSAYQIEKTQELVEVSNKIASAKRLLNSHVAVSKLLYLMQDLTVKRIRLTKLNYNNENNIPTLGFSGESANYNALAEQSNIFLQNKYIVNPHFGDFSLEQNGHVRISFTSGIDTSIFSYRDLVEPSSNSQEQVGEPLTTP